MTNEMDFSTVLPAELWIALFSHLFLPDLVSVSATRRSFQALATDSLVAHQALRRRFHRLGYHNDYEPTYWYQHLLTILRDPAAAYYVEDLEVENTEHRHTEADPWTVTVLPDDEALIQEAVEREEWISDSERAQFLHQLLAGDEDAMVTLMILRMPNLKRLTLPTHCWGGLDFEHLMPIVARMARTASNADLGGGKTLPLSKLEHYEGAVFNGYYGVDFESIAPLMALPSLRTMGTGWNHEEGFDWPASLPKSRVREINISNGTVPREAIVRLARGIRGPCVIRQDFGFNRHFDTPEHDWDVLEIPFADASEAEWTVGFNRH
ncbi:hypothetical protein B0H19DRAFT_1146002 [Mycena capillaripes]|nr:hypothetical protein B0H19DRAFT_1146002 [Mycena capillaripes]